MKKVICFLRVSTQQQDLEAQRKAVMKEILHDGFKLSEIETVEGKESAIKLEEQERKTLNQMKEIIKANPSIKDVYFFAIDRLARKVSIVLSIIDEMVKIGVNLHFVNNYRMQTLDKNGELDQMGRMFLTFLSIGAEMEMDIKKKRFAAAKEKMKQDGKILGGRVLYGYYRDEKGYPQIKDDEAYVVKRVFEEYVAGNTYFKIAKGLILDGYFERGITLATARVKISNIVKNLAYSGRPSKKRDYQEKDNIKYPQIVDVETQDKAIELAKDNKKAKESANIFYARGLVKASYKGKLLNMSPNIGNYSYRLMDALALGESQVNVNINVVDTIAFEEAKRLHKLFQSYESFQAPMAIEDNCKTLEQQILNLQPHMEAIREKQNRINNMYRKGRLDEDEYEEQYQETEKEMSVYVNEQRKLQSQINRLKVQKERLKEMKEEVIVYDEMTDEERFNLCQQMIDEIQIHKTDRYDYDILVFPTNTFKIGIAQGAWHYNVKGGKKTLLYTQKQKVIDFSNVILQRFKNDKRKRYGRTK